MALYPRRRHGTPITSPRHIALRHARRIVSIRNDSKAQRVAAQELQKGWQRLYSSEVPGLQAGKYAINAKQEIAASDSNKLPNPVETQQKFRVVGPRFTLPADAVYSFYPPANHEVPHEVLPHIIFNDPMMAWERRVQTKTDVDDDPKDERNNIPWLALLAFTPEELKVEDAVLKEAFKGTSIAASVQQNESMAVDLPIKDILLMNPEKVVRMYETTDDSVSDDATVLLMPSQQFNNFFSKYDDIGNPAPTASPYISRHKYLVHVRSVNVEGMNMADDSEAHTDREFGILIANRTGPLANPNPAPVIVHLVSLEGVDAVTPFPVVTPYVGLVSLFSWKYTVQPPGRFDLRKTFNQLASTQAMLRPQVPTAPSGATPTQQRVLQRLTDGYSLVRYQVQTGEETVALLRGPLVPTDPVKPKWDLLSTSGSDLHILDKQLGMLDITFSSAWNLGRTLALADRPFAAALTRVRRELSKKADHIAQAKMLGASGWHFKSRMELACSFSDTLEQITTLSKADDVTTRWASQPQAPVSVSRNSAGVAHFRSEALREASVLIASAQDGSGVLRPYNELNTPLSPDWVILYKFVLDLYHLYNVPPHYLLTDPSHVPPESLRFFVIDQAWIDACVDGALSLGNHSNRENDYERAEIKDRLKQSLDEVDPVLGYKPPVPRMGFILRSEVVSKFADLQIAVVNTKSNDPNLAPKLVRTVQMAEGMLMGFLSEVVTVSSDEALTFTVPAHQQYFMAAVTLEPKTINVWYRRVYTEDSKDNESARSTELGKPVWTRGVASPENGPVPFVWGGEVGSTRLLLPEKLASSHWKVLRAAKTGEGKDMFTEVVPTSAMLGVQLNNPVWQLKFNLPKLDPPPNWSSLSNRANLSPAGEAPVTKRLLKTPFVKEDLVSAKQLASSLSIRRHPPPHHQGTVFLEHHSQDSRQRTSRLSRRRSSSSSSSSESWSQIALPEKLDPSPICAFAPPTWIFRVWTTANPRSDEIPMSRERQDLIFSIVVEEGTEQDFLIQRADITFDAPQPSSFSSSLNEAGENIPSIAEDKVGALMDGYTGAGASMVSNLRYNVRLISDGTNYGLPILPRSTRQDPSRVPASGSREMSVFLPGVRVKCVESTVPVWVKFTLNFTYIGGLTEPFYAWVKLMPQKDGCPQPK